jgi:hypothetical protein
MSRIELPRFLFFIPLMAMCVLVSPAAWAHCAGNHSGNHPHCNGGGSSGGDQDPVFTAAGVDLSTGTPTEMFAESDSHSLDPGDVIIYRQVTMDLSGFDSLTGCNHGSRTGTLSTRPKSSEDPDIAVLRFGFSSLLDSGQTAHHILIMEGYFDNPENWPPALNNPAYLQDFYYWELAAEKKKAQREHCAGDSLTNPGGGPWEITVMRETN